MGGGDRSGQPGFNFDHYRTMASNMKELLPLPCVSGSLRKWALSTEAECSRCLYQLLHTRSVVPGAVFRQRADLSTSVCVTRTAGLELFLLQERKWSSHPAAGALGAPWLVQPEAGLQRWPGGAAAARGAAYRGGAFLHSFLSILHLEKVSVRREHGDCPVVPRSHHDELRRFYHTSKAA